jgi:predicted phage tail protein
MGAAQEIHGAKGGSSSPKAPIEVSDSLRSTNLAKILIAVGEGEFDGVPTAADIYLDNTPITDEHGNVNFPNVKWEWRSGTVDQAYIPGIPSVENETTINVELRDDTPWVRSITNTQLSAVRVRLAWPGLQSQDNSGNLGGYRIEYAIDVATDGGAYQQVLNEAVDGKTTTRYERSRRIDLPAATSGWQIRVRRLTPNQHTNKISDTMLVAGMTDVIDAKLRYPNTALLYLEFDAEQFSNIPAVTVKCRARKWQVPSNYDPQNRSYSGVWDGTFKQAWTNNPAWITFGICTEDRFGLGKRIKTWMVDKWELYRIAQYCDQAVGDGSGGMEPRFLCDMNLQGKADAWSLLRDISAIYRGMTYWAQGQLVMQADMPRAQDFDYVFTRANVIDGKFAYGSASAKTRYTRAIVSYDNPDNNYDTDVIPYADLALQRRYGDRPVEISAIGCTRASEAQRRGKWAVLSNSQDRTVSFSTGMEGVIPLPGYIIPIADSLLAGCEIGGRISAVSGRAVTLDRDTQAKAGDRLIINLPSGKAEARTVSVVNGRAITVTTAYSETPLAQLQWALDADDLAIPLYRVLKVSRTSEGNFDITALQYEPGKFDYIDSGARLEERPISALPISTVAAPASVSISSNTAIAQGLAVTTMTIAWPAVSGAVAYDVEWRKDSGNWISVQRTGATSVDITGIYAGAYLARVRAVSAFDISSIWKSSMLAQLKGKEGLPPSVTTLTAESLLFGIGLKWSFPPGAEDTQRTEIWYAPTNNFDGKTKLTDLSYPQADYAMQDLRAGATFFFWARLVDRSGNIGPFYPVLNGVMGQASSDAGPILELLVDKLTESQLGKELLSDIRKIDDLQNQINALDDILLYDAAKTYKTGDSVQVGQRIYQAAIDVPFNTPPPNPAYWLDVGQIVKSVGGIAQQTNTNSTSIDNLNGALASQASSLQVLRAASRDDKGEGELADALKGWSSTASIATEQAVRSSENEATAKQLNVLNSQVSSNAATVSNLAQTVANNQSATAQQIYTLSASVGSNTAAVQQVSQAQANTDGLIGTIWSVKMNTTAGGEKYAASFGLGLQVDPSGVSSRFVVQADTFMLMNVNNGKPVSPFAVSGGDTFINSAFIQNGTITNAMIDNVIQSNNYQEGSAGWRLDKAGNLNLNGSGVGYRLKLNNQGLYLTDTSTNVVVVELGVLS